MRVGVDIDEVLVDLANAAIRQWNTNWTSHENFKPISYDSWTVWNQGGVLGITRTEFLKLLEDAWDNHTSLNPMENGLPQTLSRLRQEGHTIHIISNAGMDTAGPKFQWLRANKIPHDAVSMNLHGFADKFSYPIDVLIDDSPFCPNEVKRYPGKALFLRDRPWNRELLTCSADDPIFRVYSVAQAVDLILHHGTVENLLSSKRLCSNA